MKLGFCNRAYSLINISFLRRTGRVGTGFRSKSIRFDCFDRTAPDITSGGEYGSTDSIFGIILLKFADVGSPAPGNRLSIILIEYYMTPRLYLDEMSNQRSGKAMVQLSGREE